MEEEGRLVVTGSRPSRAPFHLVPKVRGTLWEQGEIGMNSQISADFLTFLEMLPN
jgi:hypothetical protein